MYGHVFLILRFNRPEDWCLLTLQSDGFNLLGLVHCHREIKEKEEMNISTSLMGQNHLWNQGNFHPYEI